MSGICPKCERPEVMYLDGLHQAHCSSCNWSERIEDFDTYVKKYPEILMPKLPFVTMFKPSSNRISLAETLYAIATEENKLQGLVPLDASSTFNRLPAEAKCVYLAMVDFILLNYEERK